MKMLNIALIDIAGQSGSVMYFLALTDIMNKCRSSCAPEYIRNPDRRSRHIRVATNRYSNCFRLLPGSEDCPLPTLSH